MGLGSGGGGGASRNRLCEDGLVFLGLCVWRGRVRWGGEVLLFSGQQEVAMSVGLGSFVSGTVHLNLPSRKCPGSRPRGMG